MKIIKKLDTFFRQLSVQMQDGETRHTTDLAMAALLCEVATVDKVLDSKEEQAKIKQLVFLLEITHDEATRLLEKAKNSSKRSVSIYEFTSKLRDTDYDQRYILIQAMWIIAYADGVIDKFEEALIRQVSELIYITHSDFIRAKLSAKTR